MEEGIRSGRLWEEEKIKLAERIASLDVIWNDIRAGAPDPEPCLFNDTGQIASVDCGGKRLAYHFAEKSFETSQPPAAAAHLAGVLLERFARARFAAAKRLNGEATGEMAEEIRSRLKAAGYIGH